MEHRQLKCDLVSNTYHISYETILKAVEKEDNLIKIGNEYYFNAPFKGKLGCELYRGFSFKRHGVDNIIF